MLSLDGNDGSDQPLSMTRSDCSTISATGDWDVFTPRPECHFYRPMERVKAARGDVTPRLPSARPGVTPHFSLQPYLTSYVMHSQLKASLLAKGSGYKVTRPFSAPVARDALAVAGDVVVINGMRYVRYVPAGPVASEQHQRPGSAAHKLKLSRTYTDFSSPSNGPMESASPERQHNCIRIRPWTAQPRTSAPSYGAAPEKALETDAPTLAFAPSSPRGSNCGHANAGPQGPSAPALAATGSSHRTHEDNGRARHENAQHKRPSSAGFAQHPSAPSAAPRPRPSSALPASGTAHGHKKQVSFCYQLGLY